MSKCNSCICNICGKHIENEQDMLVIKAKRRWLSWHESGWIKEKIHICKPCQDKVKSYTKENL